MPSIMLSCGHIMHISCLIRKLRKRWPGPRITFFFTECPTCRKPIEIKGCPEIEKELSKIHDLFNLVKSKALQRFKFEGLEKLESERLLNPKDKFYLNPEGLALAKLSYYMCYKCQIPYFGGLKSCENDNENLADYKAEELICGKCAGIGNMKSCKIHGNDFLEYKCKFCCSVAQWFCWGTTHFCQNCHQRQLNGDYISKYPIKKLPKCPGPMKCPLKIEHLPNGTEFAIGCAICRNNIENYKTF